MTVSYAREEDESSPFATELVTSSGSLVTLETRGEDGGTAGSKDLTNRVKSVGKSTPCSVMVLSRYDR